MLERAICLSHLTQIRLIILNVPAYRGCTAAQVSDPKPGKGKRAFAHRSFAQEGFTATCLFSPLTSDPLCGDIQRCGPFNKLV